MHRLEEVPQLLLVEADLLHPQVAVALLHRLQEVVLQPHQDAAGLLPPLAVVVLLLLQVEVVPQHLPEEVVLPLLLVVAALLLLLEEAAHLLHQAEVARLRQQVVVVQQLPQAGDPQVVLEVLPQLVAVEPQLRAAVAVLVVAEPVVHPRPSLRSSLPRR